MELGEAKVDAWQTKKNDTSASAHAGFLNSELHNQSTEDTQEANSSSDSCVIADSTRTMGSELESRGSEDLNSFNRGVHKDNQKYSLLRDRIPNLRRETARSPRGPLYEEIFALDPSLNNQTDAQLDQDLDFDENLAFIQQALPPGKEKSASPWRQLRAGYTSPNTQGGGSDQTLAPIPFNSPSFQHLAFSRNKPNHVEEELSKQVISYRIQIKLFKTFLQRLIDSTNGRLIHVSELTQMQDHLHGSPFAALPKRRFGVDIENPTSEEYDELMRLNEDLYKTVEDFEHTIAQKDIKLEHHAEKLEVCSGTINEIINFLIKPPASGFLDEATILRFSNHELLREDSLELRLGMIRVLIVNLLQNNLLDKRPCNHTAVALTLTEKELLNNVSVMKRLFSSIEYLKEKFNSLQQASLAIEEKFQEEINQSRQGEQNYDTIIKKFEEHAARVHLLTCASSDHSVDHDANSRTSAISMHDFLDRKNSSDTLMSTLLSNEVDSRNTGAQNIRKNDEVASSKGKNYLYEQLQALQEKYRKLEEESSLKLSAMGNHLRTKKNYNSIFQEKERIIDQIKYDLNVAVDKQRLLKAENIKLMYANETSNKDKLSYQSTINNLTEKITTLTVESPLAVQPQVIEQMNKRITLLENQIGSLLLLDIKEFQRLMKSFVIIADDASLVEPMRKLERLLSIKNLYHDPKDMSQLWEQPEINTILNNHKSVFDYFVRAVEVIVNDHVKLLLKENDSTVRTNDYVARLHKRIDDLNSFNDNLSHQLDQFEISERPQSNETVGRSLRLKIRIEELSNRWKSEREFRVYENKALHGRINELLLENTKLREQIDKVQ